MKLNDPNLLGIERYAEALYWQDRLRYSWVPLWEEIVGADRDRYRKRAIELVHECKAFCEGEGHTVE